MGGEALYVICKYGGYYRPNAAGYTNDVTKAGRYTLAQAISHSHPNGPDGPRDGITYHLAPEVSTPAKAGEDGVREAGRLQRLLNIRDRQLKQCRAKWLDAARKALDGDMRDLRMHVALEMAPPVAVVLSNKDATYAE